MLGALADAFDDWCRTSSIWPLTPAADTASAVERFYDEYLASPFRDQAGGSRFNNLLWLFLLTRATRPSLIVDSGTYRGASAWAFANAEPECPILSFDIDLSSLARRTPGVTFLQSDWATHEFTGYDLSRSLAYFDDHVDQGRRLEEAAARGVPWLVFDDDFPVTSFVSMAHDGNALPKIEFLLDDGLRGVSTISWERNGREIQWPIDHQRLERLRTLIAATDRLPNTSLITGIHQTPYRLVSTAIK
ncbi:MAG: hypothetical protein LW698_02830 [Planctomycetaceae bacterium]|nr:hypothetical protein [Planctomycetaceae bacterium]